MSTLLQNPKARITLLFVGLALIWLAAMGHRQPPLATPAFHVPEVDIAQAKVMMDAGAIVIDVRGAEAYARQHIAGALLIPLEVLRAAIPASLASAKDKPIVVYCGEGLSKGPEGAHLLQLAGYTHAASLKPGMEGWAAAGMPVSKG